MASESQMSCVSDSNGNRVPRRGATRVLLLKDYPPEYIGRVGYHHPPLRRQLGKGCREVYFSKSGFRQHMIQHREHGDIERGPIDIAVYKRKFEKGEQGRVKLTRLDTGREDSEGATEGEDTADDMDELEEEGVHTSQHVRQSNGPHQRAPDSLPALPPLPDEPQAAFNWLSASWKRDLHLERMAATDQLNTARRRLEAVRANKLKAQEELLQATRAEEQQQEAERAAVEECHRRLKGIQRREQEYDALHRRWLAMTHKQNNMVETERSVEGDATQEMGAGSHEADCTHEQRNIAQSVGLADHVAQPYAHDSDNGCPEVEDGELIADAQKSAMLVRMPVAMLVRMPSAIPPLAPPLTLKEESSHMKRVLEPVEDVRSLCPLKNQITPSGPQRYCLE